LNEKSYALILTKKGLGNILGDFFTNSSVHPCFGPCVFVKSGFLLSDSDEEDYGHYIGWAAEAAPHWQGDQGSML
jgi:hypothetical protein